MLAVNVDKAMVWCFEFANEWCRGGDVLVVGVGQMSANDFYVGRMVVVAWWLMEIEENEALGSLSPNTGELGWKDKGQIFLNKVKETYRPESTLFSSS